MASYSTDLAIARYPQLLGGFRIKLQKHLLRPSQGERACIRVNKGGLDLSKEVLWVSVCQRVGDLPAGKVGGLKKNSATRPGSRPTQPRRAAWQKPTVLL